MYRKIVSLYHNTKVIGHPGRWKMLELVSQNYWWPQMLRYIEQYINTCDLCLCTKAARRPLVRELHSILVPDTRWDILSIDFVVELPKSFRYNAIITVVDSVSKRAHFILIYTTVTPWTAQAYNLRQ